MLYKLIKITFRIGIRLYYSEIKIKNAKKMVHDGPAILIANHPNTLIDAMLIGLYSPKPIYFMAKATFFNSNFKNRLLRSLNMIPVNRMTDGKTEGVDNNSSFEECYKLLGEGKTLVVFPEGSSFMELHLRQLKSGTARIALEAEKRFGGKLNLRVIPLGLIYTEGDRFRSSILMNVGDSISVTHRLEEYASNPSLAAKKLTEEFRHILENQLVTTKNKEQEKLVTEIAEAMESRYLQKAVGVESEVELLKKVRDRVQFLMNENPERLEDIQKELRNLNWKTQQLNIKNDFLDRGIRSTMFIRQLFFSLIGIILGLPFFIYGFIHNAIPYKVTDLIIPSISKEKEFYAPLAIAIGLILYPLTYAAFLCLYYFAFNASVFQLLILFVLMPLTGLFAHSFNQYLLHINFKLNFISLILNNKKFVLDLKEQRKRLFNLTFSDE